MKKILTAAVLSLSLLACGHKLEVRKFAIPGQQVNLELQTENAYETGLLKVGQQEFQVHEVAAASGVKLANQEGTVSIHFKKGEGVLDYGKYSFPVKEIK